MHAGEISLTSARTGCLIRISKADRLRYTLENEVAEVDDQLRQRAIQDIRIQALMAYMNQYFGNYRRGSETVKKEWDDAYARMLDFANVGQAESVFSPAFADVVSNMAGIDIFMKHERRTNDDNERNQLLFDWYKTNLQGRVQEAAMGLLILEDESREYLQLVFLHCMRNSRHYILKAC